MRAFMVSAFFGLIIGTSSAQAVSPIVQEKISAFNQRLEDATKRMNNADVMSLWAEDGISLLPSTDPLIGKAAISAFLDRVTSSIQNATMDKFEMKCSAAEGDENWASEWCDEHQIVSLPGGKPPFDGRGRMLFVLHKQSNGDWKIEREMWQQANQR